MAKSGGDDNLHYAWLGKLIAEDRHSEESTCDLVLMSEGRGFPVHKNIMMIVSKYFKKMFTIEMKEKYEGIVKMLQIPHQRLASLIEFIYSGRIEITEALKERCKTVMLRIVSAFNCLKLRAYARRYNLADVFVKINQVITANLAAVVQHEDFLQLGVDDLYAVINLRNKTCEEAVLSGILQWVNHNPPQREELFVNLLLKLDPSLMRTHFLNEVSKEELVRSNLVCSNFLVQNLLRVRQDPPAAAEFGRQQTGQSLYQRKAQRLSKGPKFTATSGNDTMMRSGVSTTISTRHQCITAMKEYESTSIDELRAEYYAAVRIDSVACTNKCLLVVGGEESPKECVVYNVDTKKATQLPKTSIERLRTTSVKVGSKVFVAGGIIGVKPIKTCEMLEFNEPTAWKLMPDMLTARRNCSSCYFKGNVYVTGGCDGQRLSSCERFDIQNNKWIKIKDMIHARDEHGTVVCNGFMYCIGGFDGSKRLSSCERYDVSIGVWNEIAPLNQARCGLACVVLDGNIYAIGGFEDGGHHLSTVERFNPTISKWENIASLQQARCLSSACVVGNKIFVVGGFNGKNLKSVEVYDPFSNVWTIAFEMEKSVSAATVVAI